MGAGFAAAGFSLVSGVVVMRSTLGSPAGRDEPGRQHPLLPVGGAFPAGILKREYVASAAATTRDCRATPVRVSAVSLRLAVSELEASRRRRPMGHITLSRSHQSKSTLVDIP